jgi:hypothetical protein
VWLQVASPFKSCFPCFYLSERRCCGGWLCAMASYQIWTLSRQVPQVPCAMSARSQADGPRTSSGDEHALSVLVLLSSVQLEQANVSRAPLCRSHHPALRDLFVRLMGCGCGGTGTWISINWPSRMPAMECRKCCRVPSTRGVLP